MPNGEDFVLAPVLAGMCQYESLLDGSLDLADIDRMNEALSIKAENEYRAQQAVKDRP